MKPRRWLNCWYSDIVKLCIHNSIERKVTICDPKNCKLYISYEQVEECIKTHKKEITIQ